ncbi:MAG TPA: hypothetical protein IAB55_08765 [Candidatus Merdivicinus faecavium]|nr:hypothetical protein [Candidatus Merdivicinus faecavium]
MRRANLRRANLRGRSPYL